MANILGLLGIDRTSVGVVATLFLLFAFVLAVRGSQPRRLHPPGPAPERLFGNARQIPNLYPWLWYTELSKTYGDALKLSSFSIIMLTLRVGDVIYVSALGQPMLVLNSLQSIGDLMQKKSSIFGGRPYLAMITDLCVICSSAVSRIAMAP